MTAAIFLLMHMLAADALTITHCADSLSAALRAQIATPTEPVAITCANRTMFVAARGRHEAIAFANVDDASLAAQADEAITRLQALSTPARLPANAPAPACAPAPEPEPPFKRRTEIWIQPLGSVVLAGYHWFYLSLGATVDVVPKWELVNSLGLIVGNASADGGDDQLDGPSNTWQLWLSSAFVHRWYLGMAGARSGFFLGPKLTVAVAHSGRYTFTTAESGGVAPSATAFAIEVGYEAGIRFQFTHFDLTLTVPSISIGYEFNRAGTVMTIPTTMGDSLSQNGIGYDTDFNLLRLGIDF